MKDLGCEAYGIYFMLLEVLRDQQGFKYPIKDLDLLEVEFGTSLAKINAVVKGYELFQLDELNNFFSLKFNLYLQPYIEKSERARTAANIRWENTKLIECKSNANAYANAKQMQCVGNASKVKESKVKESKEDKKATSDEIAMPSDESLNKIFFEELKNKCSKLNLNYPEDIDKLKADEKCLVYIEYCHKYYGTKKQYKDYSAASRTFLTEVSKLRSYKKSEEVKREYTSPEREPAISKEVKMEQYIKDFKDMADLKAHFFTWVEKGINVDGMWQYMQENSNNWSNDRKNIYDTWVWGNKLKIQFEIKENYKSNEPRYGLQI